MKCRTLLATALLSALALPLPAALAASSDWTRTPGGDLRLVALPPDRDGAVRAVLDIRLNAGWTTYWRDPGGAGVPPSLTVSGATLETIGFPVPKRLGTDDLHYAGYDAPVGLPLRLRTATGPITAAVFLGVCKEICIPVQTELTVDPGRESSADPLEETIVAAAEAALPAAASAGLEPVSGRWSADGKTLFVRFRAPAGTPPPEVYVSGPADVQFGLAEAMTREGDGYLAEVPVLFRSKHADLSHTPLLLALRAGARTMEAPLPLE